MDMRSPGSRSGERGPASRLMPIVDYYRCPQEIPDFDVFENPQEPSKFFRFGDNVICYGRVAGSAPHATNGDLFDASQHIYRSGNTIYLAFDPGQSLDNLRYERYVSGSEEQRWLEKSWVHDVYYRLRPMFPISLRRQLQRIYLRNWDTLSFPSWPVDRSVDTLVERLLVLAMQASGTERLPFIWFWPEGHKACAIVTHDVETLTGRDFSERLMDIDDAFGIKAAFQVVPEKRYPVPPAYLETIRNRGCELNLHGLDHEGNPFKDRAGFMESARKINQYAELFGSRGFRSPGLYRNTDWFQELNFSYDMSVPNVARLEPQRGGCCTVMPYFLPGGMLELPLTTAEDYSVFSILKDYSMTLWKQQMSMIMEGHGLMSFVVHPDYVTSRRAQDVYKALLGEIDRVRSNDNVWVTLPGEVDRWWRARSEMKLVPAGQNWKIEGIGSERARVAYACLDGDRLVYEIGSEVSE